MIVGTFSGFIGKDAEIREYGGRKFVSFSVAVNVSVQKGEDKVQWINVAFSNEKLAPYLKKGKQVMVIGRLTFSVYKNEPHVDCTATYLELLGKKEG